MTPADRLDLIKRLIPALVAMNTGEVHLHLMEFGFPVIAWDDWSVRGSEADWVIEMIRRGTDDQLAGLSEYLFREVPQIDGAHLPWRPGEFRLFLSHIAKEKVFVAALSADLASFGVHGFVAHEHIEPGQEWAEIIRGCLFSCDALVAVMHPGFHDSSWTDQEVGFVMGQSKFAVAVRAGIDPYGFLGMVQGIPAPEQRTAPEVAREILRVLCAEPRTSFAIRDALVNKLVHSGSYIQSNNIVDFLRQCPKLTKEQYERLRRAQKSNDQVGNAFNVPSLLDPLSGEYGPVAPLNYDTEPF